MGWHFPAAGMRCFWGLIDEYAFGWRNSRAKGKMGNDGFNKAASVFGRRCGLSCGFNLLLCWGSRWVGKVGKIASRPPFVKCLIKHLTVSTLVLRHFRRHSIAVSQIEHHSQL